MVAAGLSYGKCSAVDKALAFLWSAWLMSGPSYESFAFFIDSIASVTTDQGTEMHMLDIPNLKKAFWRTVCGFTLEQVKDDIDFTTPLFRKALRISGLGPHDGQPDEVRV